jgi:hypothetical protein
MTTVKHLPLVLNSLTFNTTLYQAYKIDRPYMEEKWLVEWRKNLGILRMRFHNENIEIS